MLYAMEPTEADWYTQAGFWLSVVGVAVSTIGLAATYYQVRKARKSADAARDAAEATLRVSHASFRRYLATVAHRQSAEVEGFVSNSRWELAGFRCEDIAATFAQLGETASADEYRYFSTVFRDKIENAGRRVGQKRWATQALRSKKLLDHLTAPFEIKGVKSDNE